MAETPQRRGTISTSDVDAQEAAARAAHAALPPRGYMREEELKKRDDRLQRDIEKTAAQMIMGTLDQSKLQLQNEIQNRVKYLHVSNMDPNYKYAWVSKNNYMQHIQRLKQVGWQTVQGNDPEAMELIGTGGIGSGAGTPDTTRQLGDVILMKIPLDRYTMIRAAEHARTIQLQHASANDLIALVDRYARYGVRLRNDPRTGEHDQYGGPSIQPRAFTEHPYALSNRRHAGMAMLDKHLRQGMPTQMRRQRGAA